MEPTRIHVGKDPVQQPEVHCEIDRLVAQNLHRLLSQPDDMERAIADLIGAVGPAIVSDSDPAEYNWVRLAMYGRHLGDHLYERLTTALSDVMTRQFHSQYGFLPDLQERYGRAVLLADGTIGEELDLGGGLVAYIDGPEDGDNYPTEEGDSELDLGREFLDQQLAEGLRRRAHQEGSTNADPH